MLLITRGGRIKGDMILALGSLITKSRENAYRVGLIVHATAAFGFALVYTLLMVTLGLLVWISLHIVNVNDPAFQQGAPGGVSAVGLHRQRPGIFHEFG